MPFVGKQYQLAATVTILSLEGGAATVTVEGEGTYEVTPVGGADLNELGTWTEIEPAYTAGALYEDLDGRVWRRHVPEDGDSGGDLAWSPPELDHPNTYDYIPERPLTRLYPEDALPE